MSNLEIQSILKVLKTLDTNKVSPELVAWLRELFIHCGRLIRSGEKLEAGIENFIRSIDETTLLNIFPDMFDPNNIEYDIYSYNKDLDYYFENECSGKEQYEEFIEDVDEKARNILMWRDDYDCILTMLDILSTGNKNLFPVWRKYFGMISEYDGFLISHIFVRPEMAKEWNKYATKIHIPSNLWWSHPNLTEDRPLILPLEIELAKAESGNIKIPNHIMERARKKLFPQYDEKSFIDMVKERLVRVVREGVEDIKSIIEKLGGSFQPVQIPQLRMIRAATETPLVQEEMEIGNFAHFNLWFIPKGTKLFLSVYALQKELFRGLTLCLIDKTSAKIIVEHSLKDDDLSAITEEELRYDLEITTESGRISFGLALEYKGQKSYFDIN